MVRNTQSSKSPLERRDERKDHSVEGPLSFPMPDRQARALDHLLKSLPSTDDYAYRKAVLEAPPTELNTGERSDVSWISTESLDRCKEVVLSKGMNDSQFAANPLVTMGHSYWCPPVGRSLWRKRIFDALTCKAVEAAWDRARGRV
jgi:hypothetical protein